MIVQNTDISSFPVQVLETECLKHDSTVLVDIGLCLLKFVSSHRGLTPALFDEYTRRQYIAKNPSHNPFGTDEEPAKFHDFDVFTKVRASATSGTIFTNNVVAQNSAAINTVGNVTP